MDPSFLWRPDIFIRACWRKMRKHPERCLARTAWGDWLEVEPRRFIGRNVYMRGVHELAVCEALWRLAGRGERVVDVGANIGVMTSVLSKRVGCAGRVTAFEAHPAVFGVLERNVRRWEGRRIELVERAASAERGRVRIWEGEWFGGNEGTARVGGREEEEEKEHEEEAKARSFEVAAVRVDETIEGCEVMKVDVEGHEFEVMSGAERLLAKGLVRDIVFESRWEFANKTHELLVRHGYELFELGSGLWGPVLGVAGRRSGEMGRTADYVATLDPNRLRMVMQKRGWRALGLQIAKYRM